MASEETLTFRINFNFAGVGKGVSQLDRLEEASKDVQQQTARTIANSEKMGDSFVESAQRAANAQELLAQSTANTNRNLSRGNQALFSLGDAFNDAQQFQFGFSQGLRGVGNNLTFMSEQISNLASKSGGLRGAFKTLGASLLGPGGIILGINIAVSALTIFGDKLFSTTEEVDKFNIELKKSNDFLTELTQKKVGDFVSSFEGLDEQMDAVNRAIDNLVGSLPESVDIMSQMEDIVRSNKEEFNATNRIVNDTFFSFKAQEEPLNEIEQRALKILQNKRAELRAQQEINKVLDLQARKTKEIEESTTVTINAVRQVSTQLLTGESITQETIDNTRARIQARQEEARRVQEIADSIKGSYVEISEEAKRSAAIATQTVQQQAAVTREEFQKISTIVGIAGQGIAALFGQSKAAAIASAVINGAQAITRTFAEFGFTPFGIGAAAAQAAVTAAQIAKIKSTEIGSGGDSGGGGGFQASEQGIAVRDREDVSGRGAVNATRGLSGQPIIMNNITLSGEFDDKVVSVKAERGRKLREKGAVTV